MCSSNTRLVEQFLQSRQQIQYQAIIFSMSLKT